MRIMHRACVGIPDGCRASAAVADGTVYFTSSTGSLAAIDAATGQPKWVFVAEYERKFEAKNLHGYPSAAQTIPDAWDVFTSSPAVETASRPM